VVDIVDTVVDKQALVEQEYMQLPLTLSTFEVVLALLLDLLALRLLLLRLCSYLSLCW
jgi:hypothetical protein